MTWHLYAPRTRAMEPRRARNNLQYRVQAAAPVPRSLRVLPILLLLAALGRCSALAAAVTQADGEPDPKCPDLRLWLRADAGVRDTAGHSPVDTDFSGSVAVWSDQSTRHFDVAATPEQAPSYVARQPGAGNQPAVAFGLGRMLLRKEPLHDRGNSTTLLVLQLQRGRHRATSFFVRETSAASTNRFPSNIAKNSTLPRPFFAGAFPATAAKATSTISATFPPTADSPSSRSVRRARILPLIFKTDWATPWARTAKCSSRAIPRSATNAVLVSASEDRNSICRKAATTARLPNCWSTIAP